jgi:hypothetical protein
LTKVEQECIKLNELYGGLAEKIKCTGFYKDEQLFIPCSHGAAKHMHFLITKPLS